MAIPAISDFSILQCDSDSRAVNEIEKTRGFLPERKDKVVQVDFPRVSLERVTRVNMEHRLPEINRALFYGLSPTFHISLYIPQHYPFPQDGVLHVFIGPTVTEPRMTTIADDIADRMTSVLPAFRGISITLYYSEWWESFVEQVKRSIPLSDRFLKVTLISLNNYERTTTWDYLGLVTPFTELALNVQLLERPDVVRQIITLSNESNLKTLVLVIPHGLRNPRYEVYYDKAILAISRVRKLETLVLPKAFRALGDDIEEELRRCDIANLVWRAY